VTLLGHRWNLTDQDGIPHLEGVPATSLTVTPAQQAVVTKIDGRLAQARAVVDAALLAPKIGDDGDTPEGMTEEEARIAKHALEPSKSAPVYISIARGLVELQMKLEAGLVDDAPKLVHHLVHVVKAREYERVIVGGIDVEATPVEEK
jgi:hypothetical protein